MPTSYLPKKHSDVRHPNSFSHAYPYVTVESPALHQNLATPWPDSLLALHDERDDIHHYTHKPGPCQWLFYNV